MEIPSPRARTKARIEIIPLIDIIFFLLATFVMVSLSMVKNRGIPVNLPAVETGAPRERQDYLTITITERGEIFFDKDPVTREQLPGRLSELKASHAEPTVFLNGDADARLGTTIEVLDEVRKAGIFKVAIETKPRSNERAEP